MFDEALGAFNHYYHFMIWIWIWKRKKKVKVQKIQFFFGGADFFRVSCLQAALPKKKKRRSGLIISYAEPFYLWISNAEKAKYLPEMIQKIKPFEKITLADIRPYDVIFDYDESLKEHHQEITTAFILDSNVKAVFTNEKSEISPDLFYPGAPLGKYHIPNYIKFSQKYSKS